MRVVAIIQARTGSSRLPSKVLIDLAGKPMLAHVIERAQRIANVDEVVVATTANTNDDALTVLVQKLGVRVIRGSEDDVLSRYHLAATETAAEWIVRITSDCPLLSPWVSGLVVADALKYHDQYDYVSNTLERSYPRGLDTEVLSKQALDLAHREATEQPDREHVTRFIFRQPERFRLRSVRMRWTVDQAEDYQLVERIFAELYRKKPDFDYLDVLASLHQHPQWSVLNAAVDQKRT